MRPALLRARRWRSAQRTLPASEPPRASGSLRASNGSHGNDHFTMGFSSGHEKSVPWGACSGLLVGASGKVPMSEQGKTVSGQSTDFEGPEYVLAGQRFLTSHFSAGQKVCPAQTMGASQHRRSASSLLCSALHLRPLSVRLSSGLLAPARVCWRRLGSAGAGPHIVWARCPAQPSGAARSGRPQCGILPESDRNPTGTRP